MRIRIKRILVLSAWLLSSILAEGATDKYRITWREDPATSMVIAWNQRSGTNPMVFLDVMDYGQEFSRYKFSKAPDLVIDAKGMKNHFVRLRNLKPSTVYYFVIRDSEGVSKRFSFRTAPANSGERLSIISGGDSRNNREVRQDANSLVGKLRPHMVLFNGDMTEADTPLEWQQWLDDWQLSIASDGRMTPILVARGNHEASNETLSDLFDPPSAQLFYAHSFGGDLLRIYTLNSLLPPGGAQATWLDGDLGAHSSTSWKIVQYHYAMRPHTARKPENNDQYQHWAPLFYGYQVQLAIESDAHVVKTTWPIAPSTGPDNHEGFVRDDRRGTVYIGEGGWGAPLRDNNDEKPWTRASGSFNQFNWIFVDDEKMEIRVVRVDGAESVQSVDPSNIFKAPLGLSVWKPSSGDVVTIFKDYPEEIVEEPVVPVPSEEELAARELAMEMMDFSATKNGSGVEVIFSTQFEPLGMLYELQRSADGGAQFTTIAQIRGEGQTFNKYRALDVDLSSVGGARILYRLRRIFPNGEVDLYYPNKDISEDSGNWDALPKLVPDAATGQVKIAYSLNQDANVRIRLINPQLREVVSVDLPNQSPGKYLKSLDLKAVPPGRYLLVVRANSMPLRRFRVVK